jgi:hypothetical protein
MGGQRKGGLFAGLLAALGFGGLRMADNCAMVGARAADDIAFAGSRTAARGLDDIGRGGARGLDDVVVHRGAGRLDDAARVRVVPHPGVGAVDEGAGSLEHLAEVATDVGLELVSYDYEVDDIPPPEQILTEVQQPQFVDLSIDAGAWSRLARGEHDAVAPWVFVARSRGESLAIGGELVSLEQLAATCWSAGTGCVFVACESGCSDATRLALRETSLRPGERLEPYMARLVSSRALLGSQPSFIAITGGGPEPRLELLRPPAP